MDDRERVLEYIKNNPGKTRKEIMAALGLKRYIADQILGSLYSYGLVWMVGGKNHWTYEIPGKVAVL